jgi:hypothetical protein
LVSFLILTSIPTRLLYLAWLLLHNFKELFALPNRGAGGSFLYPSILLTELFTFGTTKITLQKFLPNKKRLFLKKIFSH